MKRILITGSHSYIGTNVEKWLNRFESNYQVDTVDMKAASWKEKSFAGYDVVFHVAGIAHVSADPKLKELYFAVNRDLVIETAQKAKQDGVRQFIFMSSLIVYGNSGRIGTKKMISAQTKEAPADFYGESKLQAEKGILPLADSNFKVAVIRPPMIYGKDSKGNYRRLSRLAQKLPVFPDIENCRSMLYIDNLCEFIRLLIEEEQGGIFFPQNKEYVSTSEMVKVIAACHGRKMHLVKLFNPAVYVCARAVGMINKVFGNLAYEREMSDYWDYQYCVVDFEESIRQTER